MPRITFGYSDSEDRIWLASSEGGKYWLTRRLLERFIRPCAELLERTVPGGEVPNALPARQRIAIEHAEAMADSPEGEPALARDLASRDLGQPPGTPRLVNTLRLDASENACRLTLVAAGEETVFELSRLDYHRLLGALVLTARNAEWRLDLPNWLSANSTAHPYASGPPPKDRQD